MRYLHILAACTVLAGPALAEDPKPWPFPEDIPSPAPADPGLAGQQPPNIVRFLKVRGVGATDLSPDGKTIAFRMSVTGEPQLWTVPAAGGWPRQITFGGAVSNHRWLPTGDMLYGADREGDERLGLKVISADGTRERIARPYSEAFIVPGPTSADGRYLAYSTTQRNGTDFDIHILDLQSGDDRAVYEGRFGFFVRAWRPNGDTLIVSETVGEDGNNLYALNAETGAMETLFKPVEKSAYEDITWLPDGSGFYLTTNQDRDYKALAFYSWADKSMAVVVAPDHDVDSVALAGNGRYLVWTQNEGGYSRLRGLDRATGKPIQAPEGLPVGVYGLDGAAKAPVMAVSVGGPSNPGDIFTWDIAEGTVVHAARSDLAGLDAGRFVTPETLFFEASDGVRLNGLFYAPKKATAGQGKPPVVVNVHGGPTGQARPRFSAVIQYLVAQGVAVFDLNFRGSTGFGRRFADLDNQFNRTDSVRDVADAIDWLATTGRVDASRAAVMGGSYGGYLTNAVVGMYPDKFVAGVSFVGVSDWVRALETASPALKASDRIEYGDITDPKVRDFHARISPINFVDNITASLMVLHGANEPRDPIEESDALVKAIRAKGGTVQYLRFPDEGHGIRKLENRITAYRRIAAFLRDTLK
ncbi:MAG: S9 family peptidase [Alphaproteobacteria bacterium]